jgi:CheY-like chemotaxis protein
MTLILLVEDDADLRELLVQTLPYYGGFRVFSATNGIEGLERCQELHPACMVIDVKMPGLDGFQLARALRGDPQTATIPLIILTALTQDAHRFTGLASGADRFLQKPVSPQQLVAAIQEVIELSEAERLRHYQQLATGENGHDD